MAGVGMEGEGEPGFPTVADIHIEPGEFKGVMQVGCGW